MRPQPRILIVEDESAIVELIAVNLRHHGMTPVIAHNGEQAQVEVQAVLPDVIVLDWMLPGVAGLELARLWRKDPRTRNIPILMLTARSDDKDKIKGLDAGADDYITKPFSTQELMARIRAALRRSAPVHAATSSTIGPIHLDSERWQVTVDGVPVRLGPTEFRLLAHLMSHPDRVHTRSSLLDQVWGDHVYIEERTVDVHIKRLREALDSAASLIETVRGVGYRLATVPASPPPDAAAAS